MNDEYLPAPRSAMMIRIVQPSRFRNGIVDERRPLSFASELTLEPEPAADPWAVAVATLALLLMLVAFGFTVAYGLNSLLNAL